MDSRLTNYYPWVNVFDLQKKYESVGFKDFRHAVTGRPPHQDSAPRGGDLLGLQA